MQVQTNLCGELRASCFLQQDPKAACEKHEPRGQGQDNFSDFVPKICPFSAGFFMKILKAPANLRLSNIPGLGSFTENKQGRCSLPQACGNATGEGLCPAACFSPLR